MTSCITGIVLWDAYVTKCSKGKIHMATGSDPDSSKSVHAWILIYLRAESHAYSLRQPVVTSVLSAALYKPQSRGHYGPLIRIAAPKAISHAPDLEVLLLPDMLLGMDVGGSNA